MSQFKETYEVNNNIDSENCAVTGRCLGNAGVKQ